MSLSTFAPLTPLGPVNPCCPGDPLCNKEKERVNHIFVTTL